MILTKAHAYSFAVDDLFSHTLSYLLFLMSQFNCINSWILNNGNQARNDIAWPTRLLARIIQYSSISCTTRFLVYRAPGSCEILDHYRGFHSHFIPLVTQCDINLIHYERSGRQETVLTNILYTKNLRYSVRDSSKKRNSDRCYWFAQSQLTCFAFRKPWFIRNRVICLSANVVSLWSLCQDPCVKASEIELLMKIDFRTSIEALNTLFMPLSQLLILVPVLRMRRRTEKWWRITWSETTVLIPN